MMAFVLVMVASSFLALSPMAARGRSSSSRSSRRFIAIILACVSVGEIFSFGYEGIRNSHKFRYFSLFALFGPQEQAHLTLRSGWGKKNTRFLETVSFPQSWCLASLHPSDEARLQLAGDSRNVVRSFSHGCFDVAQPSIPQRARLGILSMRTANTPSWATLRCGKRQRNSWLGVLWTLLTCVSVCVCTPALADFAISRKQAECLSREWDGGGGGAV